MSKAWWFGIGLFSAAIALNCAAGPTLTLQVIPNTTAHTFGVYATDSIGDNAGLASFDIDVVGYGGWAVTLFTKERAPRGFNADQGLASGFVVNVSNGAAGIEVSGTQPTNYAGGDDPNSAGGLGSPIRPTR